MVPVDALVAHLKATPAIGAIVGTLVSDYDIRRDRNPLYFPPPDGDIKTCLVVDDNGELPVFGTHMAMAQDEARSGRTFRLVVLQLLDSRGEHAIPAEPASVVP